MRHKLNLDLAHLSPQTRSYMLALRTQDTRMARRAGLWSAVALWLGFAAFFSWVLR